MQRGSQARRRTYELEHRCNHQFKIRAILTNMRTPTPIDLELGYFRDVRLVYLNDFRDVRLEYFRDARLGCVEYNGPRRTRRVRRARAARLKLSKITKSAALVCNASVRCTIFSNVQEVILGTLVRRVNTCNTWNTKSESQPADWQNSPELQ